MHDEFFDHRDEVVMLSPERKAAAVVLTLTRLPQGGSILVTVLDANQEPVAGAKLVNRAYRSDVHRAVTTDTRGQCRLDDTLTLDRAGRYELEVTAPGFVAQIVAFEPGTLDRPAPVLVQLERGHRIRGRVLLPGGKPAAKARVYYNNGENANRLGGRVETDAEGHFTADNIAAGLHVLGVYVGRVRSGRRCAVAAGWPRRSDRSARAGRNRHRPRAGRRYRQSAGALPHSHHDVPHSDRRRTDGEHALRPREGQD